MPRNQLPLDVGVIGVGSMGEHHTRVYNSLPSANLVGVFDVDETRATQVADKYDTTPLRLDALLERVDAVSIVVPTSLHYDLATTCIDANVATLIEKPVVDDLETGRKLRAATERSDVTVQVGHVERFNPAVQTLEEIIGDLSVIGITAERLGPPPGREIEDSAVLDLMIHDIDIVLTLLDEDPTSIKSTGVHNNRHASALLEFESGTMASLTASRLTQRKVRTLEITAETCLVELDYMDQSIEIYRDSLPEYVETDGNVRFRHESIVERPQIPNQEPLQLELESFLEAATSNETPPVTVDDGLRALELAQRIERPRQYEPAPSEVAHD